MDNSNENYNLILTFITDARLNSLSYGEGFNRDDGSFWKRERPVHFINFTSWVDSIGVDSISYEVAVVYKPIWVAGKLAMIDNYTLSQNLDFVSIRNYDKHVITGFFIGGEFCDEVVSALEDKFGLFLPREA